jgi:hypothetical protein
MMSFSTDPAIAKRQLLAVIFYLTAFGHMDGEFDAREREFVRGWIGRLVNERTGSAMANVDPLARAVTTERWTAQFNKVAAAIDHEIAALFTESVAAGESTQQFVHAKLALRCYELLRSFDDDGRVQLIEIVDQLIRVDGKIADAEARLRQDILALLDEPALADGAVEIEIEEPPAPVTPAVRIAAPIAMRGSADDHPFLAHGERAYPADRSFFERRAVEDLENARKVIALLEDERRAGAGRLSTGNTLVDFGGQSPFLDGHVRVLPPKPGKDYELIVVGDLHGCYSCLKAAVLQSDFLQKVQAHHDDPDGTPETHLVLLGDYIDRGYWAFDGVLRGALRLMLAAPHAVHVLRGNHEYYLEHQGRILAPVRPAEAMASLENVADPSFFRQMMQLFEALPTMLAFDRLLFVHAGIPRDETIAERFTGLASLNDPDLRFQMMWSDPSDAEHVPAELQRATARFSFGTRQLRAFLGKLGVTTLIRGHERIVEGFKIAVDTPEAQLLTLFSSGGRENPDLPTTSNYREVTPAALSILHRDGQSTIRPFELDWRRFSDPARNRFWSRAG